MKIAASLDRKVTHFVDAVWIINTYMYEEGSGSFFLYTKFWPGFVCNKTVPEPPLYMYVPVVLDTWRCS